MTGLIVIDESGDLGPNGTEYFAMAALVMLRSRHLKPAAKIIQNPDFENKWYNTNEQKRKLLFQTLAQCNFSAVYTAIKKNDTKVKNRVYGNKLYEIVVRQVISDAISVLPCRDVNVFLDRNRFMTEHRFIEIVKEECDRYGVNLKNCGFKDSQCNPCIQLSDYVAGAVHAKYEHGNSLLLMIDNKISVARSALRATPLSDRHYGSYQE